MSPPDLKSEFTKYAPKTNVQNVVKSVEEKVKRDSFTRADKRNKVIAKDNELHPFTKLQEYTK